MRLTRLAKDPDSGNFGCPSVYLDQDDPSYLVVQADLLSPDEVSKLENLLPNETGVRIKASIVLEAARRLAGQ